MEFNSVLNKYRGYVNQEIERFFSGLNKQAPVSRLYNDIGNFALSGGKRLRPIALIQAAKETRSIIPLSICVELYHASTLIHDDIMDEDTERRGKDSVFEGMRKHFLEANPESPYDGHLFKSKSTRFAITQGILAGNILDSLCLKPIYDSPFDAGKINKAIANLTECARIVNEGQVMDTLLEIDRHPTEEAYLEMISKKTGQLFVSSIQIGLIIAGAGESTYKNMTQYAHDIAQAFQLQDDIMDLSGSGKGHEIGSDIKQGKMTLLVIKALELASQEDREFLKKYLGDPSHVERIIEILQKSGAVDYVKDVARSLIEKGKSHITGLKYDFFLDFADYMLERDI